MDCRNEIIETNWNRKNIIKTNKISYMNEMVSQRKTRSYNKHKVYLSLHKWNCINLNRI